MSPPLPLDHLVISNNNMMDHRGGLLLGLALRTSPTLDLSLSPTHNQHILTTTTTTTTAYEPSLTLSLLFPAKKPDNQSSRSDNDEISSFPNSVSNNVKWERDEEPDAAAANNVYNDEYEDVNNIGILVGGGSRKKLRLNREQSALLEDSFKLQSTLNPNQKEALARQLNLRPRQVEVWFQNRRARTKLKQTEVDCEFLRKCCERLGEENQKLHKELQQLKQVAQPFYLQLSSTRITMCPSCKRLTDAHKVPDDTNQANFLASSKKRMIFSPFVKPSAAC